MEAENKNSRNFKNYFYFLIFLTISSVVFGALGLLYLRQTVNEENQKINFSGTDNFLVNEAKKRYENNYDFLNRELERNLQDALLQARSGQTDLVSYSLSQRIEIGDSESIDLEKSDLAETYRRNFEQVSSVSEDSGNLMINYYDDKGVSKRINFGPRQAWVGQDWNSEIKLSADSNYLALSLENPTSSSIYLLNNADGKREKIDESAIAGSYFKPLSFSLDKRYFFYSSDAQGRGFVDIWPGILGKVYRYDLGSKKKDDVRLLAASFLNKKYADYNKKLLNISPNGLILAFELVHSDGRSALVATVNLSDGKIQEFPVSDGFRGVNAFFSPDSSRLAFNEFSRKMNGTIFIDTYKLIVAELSNSNYYNIGNNNKIIVWLDGKNVLTKKDDGSRTLLRLVD